MTVACDSGEGGPIGLEAFAEGLAGLGFDPRDEGAFAAAGPLLGALGRNRSFLGDLMIDELKARARRQERDNDYGPQVLMLWRGEGWFVRANIWPDAADPLFRASQPAHFFYGVPHDHNFCFLTCGYFGPGYWSDYYEVDHDALLGALGEAAGLRLVRRARLAEGEVMLYRAHVDVHSQHPPDASSISINLMQALPGRGFVDQYRYDLERGTVAGQLARSSAEALLALAPVLGGEEGRGLVEDYARAHPCDRIRFGAIAALSAALEGEAGATMIAQAAVDASPGVAALARAHLDRGAEAQRWAGAR